MKQKLLYSTLGWITTVITGVSFLSGVWMYMQVSRLSSGSYSAISSMNGFTNSFVVFFIALIASLAVAVYLVLYFIYEERKLMVLINGICAFVIPTLVVMMGIGQLLSMATSLFMSSNSGLGSSFLFALLLVALHFAMNLIVMLQLQNKFQIVAITKFLPVKGKGVMASAQASTTASSNIPDTAQVVTPVEPEPNQEPQETATTSTESSEDTTQGGQA